MSRGPSTSSEANEKSAATRYKTIVDEQQKLIKLADWSEFGRGLVSEYLTDELAEISKDGQIHKAEKKQNKKLSKRRAERGKLVTSLSGTPGRPFQYQGVAEAAWRTSAVWLKLRGELQPWWFHPQCSCFELVSRHQ